MERSEQLDRLLRPTSVAVVGASTRPGWGLEAISNLRALGFTGSIFPVNPRYEEVDGLRCHPSLPELPTVPDLAIVAVPARAVPAVLTEAVAKGIGSAVVYASGFGASGQGEGGDASENVVRTEFLDLCDRKQIAVLGPNCLGAINYAGRVSSWGIAMPFTHAGVRSGVALVTQSGSTGLMLASANRGVPFAHVVSCGNQLDVTVAELFDACLRDPAVGVLAAQVEGVPDIPRFRSVLERAAACDIPVVILKVGDSELGQEATIAHTGSLSGSAVVFEALLRQCGAIQVRDLDEMLAVCALLTGPRPARARGIAVFTSSGGEVGLTADLGESVNLNFPKLPPDVATAMETLLPDFGRVSNPLDLTAGGWGDAEMYTKVIVALASVEGVDTVVGMNGSPSLETDELDEGTRAAISGMAEGARLVGPGGPSVVNLSPLTDVVGALTRGLSAGGVIPLVGLNPGLTALSKVAQRSRWVDQGGVDSTIHAGSRPAGADVAGLLAAAGSGTQSEDFAKDVLGHYGIASPARAVVSTPDAAVAAADSIGYPVALKLAVTGVAHKTELGGVLLGLSTPEDVQEGSRKLLALGTTVSAGTDAQVLVEAYVQQGLELIIGGNQDPIYGPVVMVGLGGVLTELLSDVSHRLAPISSRDASAMLDELAGTKLLDGFRGGPGLDRDALAAAVLAASQLLVDHPQIAELDINPLVFDTARGTFVALDALLVLA
ncbi:putative succinyl-CoA synthetase-like protein [metagenome]|uniref:Putative succinyl-CoA synthetase-like protein n=1 Tax=metagenome TaxID=256318 RepID=A0A2P2CBS2_9ZZZZ